MRGNVQNMGLVHQAVKDTSYKTGIITSGRPSNLCRLQTGKKRSVAARRERMYELFSGKTDDQRYEWSKVSLLDKVSHVPQVHSCSLRSWNSNDPVQCLQYCEESGA